MTRAPETRKADAPPPHAGTWSTIVAAAKVGAAMFWGVRPTGVVIPPERRPPGDLRPTRNDAEGSDEP